MSEESRRITYGDGREALLAAVVEVVAEKGLRGVTYRAVAARAGVNHTLVTHHFGSIEGLLLATMEWAVRRSISETQLEYVADVDGRFADALMSAVSSEPELQLFQFEMLLEARRQPQIHAIVERLYRNYAGAVESALRQRGLAVEGEAAQAVFAALDGLMLQYLTLGDPARIRAAVNQIVRLLSGLDKVSDEALSAS